jgi:hypothetical protein
MFISCRRVGDMEVNPQAFISMDGERFLGFHCPFLKEKPCCPQSVADESRTRTGSGGYETISVESS